MNDFENEILEALRRQQRRTRTTRSERPRTRTDADDTVFRLQMYNIIYNYNNNIRLYQESMQRYHSVIEQYLQTMSQTNEETNTNTNTNTNTRFYSTTGNNRSNLFRNTYNIIDHLLNNESFTFTDVVVCPTNEQIANATRRFEYNLQNTNHTRCPITLEDFQEGEEVCEILHCHHVFREQALYNWFTQNVRCPVCRYDIRQYSGSGSGSGSGAEPSVSEETPSTNTQTTLPIANTNLRRNQMPLYQSVLNNLTSEISHILQNYVENSSENGNGNNVVTFEIPLLYYSNSSSSSSNSNSSRDASDLSMNFDVPLD